jgi:hypothetical protein
MSTDGAAAHLTEWDMLATVPTAPSGGDVSAPPDAPDAAPCADPDADPDDPAVIDAVHCIRCNTLGADSTVEREWIFREYGKLMRREAALAAQHGARAGAKPKRARTRSSARCAGSASAPDDAA